MLCPIDSPLSYRPLLQIPKFLELIGVGYTAWFTYRYLLFKVLFSEMGLDSMYDAMPHACGQYSRFSLQSCRTQLPHPLTTFILPMLCSLVERSWLRPSRRSKARSPGLQASPSRTTRLKLELVCAAPLNAEKKVALSLIVYSETAVFCNRPHLDVCYISLN